MGRVQELDVHVSDKAVWRLIHDRLGNYPFANFEKEILAPQGLKAADFERFMRNEAALQQLIGVASLNARLVNPREAEFVYRKEHEESAAELAVFWASNYVDQVTITNGAVGRYYTNQMGRYRVPERTVVNFVAFPASNYVAEADKELAAITNLQARIDEAYARLGTNYFKDSNGVVMAEAAAKQKIRDDEHLRISLLEAHKRAAEFATELHEQPQRDRADNLERLAAAKGYLTQTSPPFDRVSGLEEGDFPPKFRQVALLLITNEPVSFDPIRGEKTVYLIALKEKIPSELPPLEKIVDKVTADYKQAQAQDLARKAGLAFHTTLTNGLAQQRTFTEICVENKVETVALPPFSASTRTLAGLDERINLRLLQNMTAKLQPGQASSFLPLPPEGGFILFLRQRLPFDEAQVKKEMPDFLGTLRNYRQSDAFNQWFRKQVEKDDGVNRWFRRLAEQDQKPSVGAAAQ
jgi:hypothetical protein